MAIPIITGTGFNLKPNGKSKFWIVGVNIAEGNDVYVKVDGDVLWQGEIDKDDSPKFRCWVKPVSKKCKKVSDGDLEFVSITVENGDGESLPNEDEAIPDGPD